MNFLSSQHKIIQGYLGDTLTVKNPLKPQEIVSVASIPIEHLMTEKTMPQPTLQFQASVEESIEIPTSDFVGEMFLVTKWKKTTTKNYKGNIGLHAIREFELTGSERINRAKYLQTMVTIFANMDDKTKADDLIESWYGGETIDSINNNIITMSPIPYPGSKLVRGRLTSEKYPLYASTTGLTLKIQFRSLEEITLDGVDEGGIESCKLVMFKTKPEKKQDITDWVWNSYDFQTSIYNKKVDPADGITTIELQGANYDIRQLAMILRKKTDIEGNEPTLFYGERIEKMKIFVNGNQKYEMKTQKEVELVSYVRGNESIDLGMGPIFLFNFGTAPKLNVKDYEGSADFNTLKSSGFKVELEISGADILIADFVLVSNLQMRMVSNELKPIRNIPNLTN